MPHTEQWPLSKTSVGGGALAAAIKALGNLACFTGNRPQIMQEGAVRPLIQLCGTTGDENKELVTNACEALANLALDSANRPQIVLEGATKPLVELLAKKITELGYSCYYIHAKMAQVCIKHDDALKGHI